MLAIFVIAVFVSAQKATNEMPHRCSYCWRTPVKKKRRKHEKNAPKHVWTLSVMSHLTTQVVAAPVEPSSAVTCAELVAAAHQRLAARLIRTGALCVSPAAPCSEHQCKWKLIAAVCTGFSLQRKNITVTYHQPLFQPSAANSDVAWTCLLPRTRHVAMFSAQQKKKLNCAIANEATGRFGCHHILFQMSCKKIK